MSPALKFGLLAFLAAVAALYFALVVWGASRLARVLLRRGYADRGWNEGRLAFRVKTLGIAGLGLSVLSLFGAVVRLVGGR